MLRASGSQDPGQLGPHGRVGLEHEPSARERPLVLSPFLVMCAADADDAGVVSQDLEDSARAALRKEKIVYPSLGGGAAPKPKL